MKLFPATKNTYRVAAVTVTYGSRLLLLIQTVEAILKDEHVTKLIIVDNASDESDSIVQEMVKYGSRVLIIRHEKNLGSAGGFARGIEVARQEDVDYIYLSDDDVTISDNFVDDFFRANEVIGNDQVVLLSRRASFWAGTDAHYAPDTIIRPRRYFNIMSGRIFKVFMASILGFKEKHLAHDPNTFFPIIPAGGWAYAGALIPINASWEAPIPDASLGLYLDDIVYSWGVIDAGYPSFALMEPHLIDSEMTHAGAHTSSGLFSPSVSSTKIYYETRNRVRVSLMFGEVKSLLAFKLQVIIWCAGVCSIGMLKHGMRTATFSRMKLIIEALRAGFNTKRPVPDTVFLKI